MVSIRLSLLMCGVFLACSLTSNAQLDITFTPGIESAFQGGTAGFTGTLENVSNSVVFLNGDEVNIADPRLIVDDSPFLNNAPLFLTAFGSSGSSYTGLLLNVTADGAPTGLFFGSFAVIGGATDSSSDQVGAQAFAIDVLPTPEPGSLALLAGAGGAGILAMRKRRLRFL